MIFAVCSPACRTSEGQPVVGCSLSVSQRRREAPFGMRILEIRRNAAARLAGAQAVGVEVALGGIKVSQSCTVL